MPGGGARSLAYGLLGAGIGLPVVLFVVAGVNAGNFGLRGAGGPLVAYSAGVLSFLSPCVLPLVPIYLAHLAGSQGAASHLGGRRPATVAHAVAFVTGLSMVFITLGASAGLAGSVLVEHQRLLEQGSGLLLVVLGALLIPASPERSTRGSLLLLAALAGLFVELADVAQFEESPAAALLLGTALLITWLRFSGLLPLSPLQRTFQFNAGGGRVSLGRSALVGGAFATGWTPCVGPILGGILTLAATSQDVVVGIYLLVAYAAGFSLPFLVTALAMEDVTRGLKQFNRWLPAFEATSAVLMIGLGALLLAGRLTALNEFFTFAGFNEGL